MKAFRCIALVAFFLSASHGLTPPSRDGEPVRRALPNSPNGYTPSTVDCPGDRPTVRSASSLSPNETAWLQKRRSNTITPMTDLLFRLNISGFDAAGYIRSHASNISALPNVGLALSGGGYRAMLNGAGAVQAWDSRTSNSTAAGQLGGLLQSATYITGLSGASWLLGSIYINNFTSITALRDSMTGSLWQFGSSIIDGPNTGGIAVLNQAEYYGTLSSQVQGKANAGFDVTITDVWGRALAFQLINAMDGGPSYTWSSISQDPDFANANTPFPIVTAEERSSGQTVVPQNATIYEFNPYEMGSWDPTTYGFVPLQYLGSNFSAGSVPANQQCVIGLDSASFVMGTSSSLFNQLLLTLNTTNLPSFLQSAFSSFANSIRAGDEDISDYSPNPFYLWNNASNPNADTRVLGLVDGGESDQTIPLQPLLGPLRNVDVIFAVDSSADTSTFWPSGSSLMETYSRYHESSSSGIANGTSFPFVPDNNTFINLGLNTKPTFFGCNASNVSSAYSVPLIVYLPNHPYTAFTNTSTYDLQYNNSQRDSFILNGYNVATMGNGSVAADWTACVGCAILSRSFDRTGTPMPDACTQCFTQYCWNGTLNSTTPNTYEPTLVLGAYTFSSIASTVPESMGFWVVLFTMLLISC